MVNATASLVGLVPVVPSALNVPRTAVLTAFVSMVVVSARPVSLVETAVALFRTREFLQAVWTTATGVECAGSRKAHLFVCARKGGEGPPVSNNLCVPTTAHSMACARPVLVSARVAFLGRIVPLPCVRSPPTAWTTARGAECAAMEPACAPRALMRLTAPKHAPVKTAARAMVCVSMACVRVRRALLGMIAPARLSWRARVCRAQAIALAGASATTALTFATASLVTRVPIAQRSMVSCATRICAVAAMVDANSAAAFVTRVGPVLHAKKRLVA